MPASDLKSTATGVASLCGPIQYSIAEAYSFLTVTSGNISLSSNSMTDINTYRPNLNAKLTNYPGVAAASIEFFVTLINPCLTTILSLPTTFLDKTITSCIGMAVA